MIIYYVFMFSIFSEKRFQFFGSPPPKGGGIQKTAYLQNINILSFSNFSDAIPLWGDTKNLFILVINNIQTYYTSLYNGFGIGNNTWFCITSRHVFLNNGCFKVRKIYLQKYV